MVMLVLSSVAGLAVAGIVWFGWGFVENVRTLRRAPSPSPSVAPVEPEPESEPDIEDLG